MTDLPIALTLDHLLVHSDWEARATVRPPKSYGTACVVVEHVRDPGLEVVLWAGWFNRTTLSQPLRQALTRAERRRVVKFAREVARMRLMLAALLKDEPAASIAITRATTNLQGFARVDIAQPGLTTELYVLNDRREAAGFRRLSLAELRSYSPADDRKS